MKHLLKILITTALLLHVLLTFVYASPSRQLGQAAVQAMSTPDTLLKKSEDGSSSIRNPRINMRIKPDILMSIEEHGFLNALQTKPTEASILLNGGVRNYRDAYLYQARLNPILADMDAVEPEPKSLYPKFGYVVYDTPNTKNTVPLDPRLEQFGEVDVEFKPEVLTRSTYSIGELLHNRRPIPMSDLSKLEQFHREENDDKPSPIWIEAHILGDISWNDVAKISVGNTPLTETQEADLRYVSEKYKIPVMAKRKFPYMKWYDGTTVYDPELMRNYRNKDGTFGEDQGPYTFRVPPSNPPVHQQSNGTKDSYSCVSEWLSNPLLPESFRNEVAKILNQSLPENPEKVLNAESFLAKVLTFRTVHAFVSGLEKGEKEYRSNFFGLISHSWDSITKTFLDKNPDGRSIESMKLLLHRVQTQTERRCPLEMPLAWMKKWVQDDLIRPDTEPTPEKEIYRWTTIMINELSSWEKIQSFCGIEQKNQFHNLLTRLWDRNSTYFLSHDFKIRALKE